MKIIIDTDSSSLEFKEFKTKDEWDAYVKEAISVLKSFLV